MDGQNPTDRPVRLAYDAVIATRNRPEALALSIPLLIAQSRPPDRLIVIDASDDPGPAAEAVRRAVLGWTGEIVCECARPGLTHQRNRGLDHVTAPVVIFLDDDSLICPGAAEAVLAVYERDVEGRIAAVAAAESRSPPEAATLEGAYEPGPESRWRARLGPFRRALEHRVSALKPALALGATLNARLARPDWLAEMDVVPVDYMTGFRMSFRAEAILPVGFDEALTGYALDEDIDASFMAMRRGLVVGARRARIYHHRHPSGRGSSFARGRMEVLNRAYVLLKHATGPIGSASLANAIWRRHLLFTAIKFVICLAGAARPAGRRRLAGAWAGHRQAIRLWRSEARTRSRLCAEPEQFSAIR